MSTKDSKEESALKQSAENNGIKYILPLLTSFSSDSRGCLVPTRAADQLQKNGWGFFAIDHYKMGFEEAEFFGVPDPKTLYKLPWRPDVGMVLCDLYRQGSVSGQCPRTKLRQLSDQARQLGFVMKTGVEPELILLKKDKHEIAAGECGVDLRVYHEPHNLLNKVDFVTEVMDIMGELGWDPYQAEHEAIAGQYEFNFGFTDCLTMADRHTMLKFFIKEVAIKHGFRATFMPTPFRGSAMGSGLHINISLWSADSDNNLMPDDQSDSGLSQIGEHFTAGVLKHAQALTAILCPHINSYKRLHATTLVEDATITWGRETRYPAIRIPNKNRIEIRWGDGSCNPYLVQAAVLAAGMDGVSNKLPLDRAERVEEDMTGKVAPPNIKRFPRTLEEAYLHLERDEVLKKYLGEEIVNSFVHIKKKQWSEFIKVITQYEVDLADDY